ncbi:MAG: class I SAM-dependent methyltransferase [Leptolinea sp.]|nr:class I SAM-dependent methyltransferase [Leptolinea sp.]
MKTAYFLPRLVRHFLPEKVTRALLLRGLFIRPGLETRAPEEAAARYQRDLKEAGVDISGKHILVFGYGGRFGLACHLLKLGARHITLCEYAVKPDEQANANLLPEFENYLFRDFGKTVPRNEWITILQGDIRKIALEPGIKKADIVCSTSVFEHLDDPDGILDALIKLTGDGGTHIHYIDLRDHFFKYPFEMLTFSASTWKNWLNPTSNLNRWRFPKYETLFRERFDKVNLLVFEHNEAAWVEIQNRVLPEFKTGNTQVDAVTQIRVISSKETNKTE